MTSEALIELAASKGFRSVEKGQGGEGVALRAVRPLQRDDIFGAIIIQ
jgi:hypothetical protein